MRHVLQPMEGRPGMLHAARSMARSSALALAALTLAFVAAAGARPLNVPDEGRYAEIAREMLRSGDWLTPRLDGVPFLDKPPLLYWLDATSLGALGVRPVAARLVPALFGAAACLLVAWAGAALWTRRAGLLSALVLASTPLWFVAAEYVNHDLAVAALLSAAMLAFVVADRATGRRRRQRLLWSAFAAAGLAVLTKGLIGLVLPAGIIGAWTIVARRWRDVPGWRLPSGVGLALAVAAPWHLLAERATPGLLHHLFVVQHFQRYAGSGFNNPGSPAFYPLVLLAGLLPWTALLPGALADAWRAFRRDRENARSEALLLLWPLVVIVFFSLPRSKIVGYVLPAVPPLALLLGRHLDLALAAGSLARRRALDAAAALMGLLGAGVAVAPFTPWLPLPAPAAAAATVTGVACLAAAGTLAWTRRHGRSGLAIGALAGFTAALVAGLLPVVPAVARDSAAPLVEVLRPRLRAGDEVACFRSYAYDLPFLLDLAAPVVVAEDWDDPRVARRDDWRRELWLGREWAPRSRGWLVTPGELARRCAGDARCFVVARTRDAAAARALLPLEPLAEANGMTLLATPAAAGIRPSGGARAAAVRRGGEGSDAGSGALAPPR